MTDFTGFDREDADDGAVRVHRHNHHRPGILLQRPVSILPANVLDANRLVHFAHFADKRHGGRVNRLQLEQHLSRHRPGTVGELIFVIAKDYPKTSVAEHLAQQSHDLFDHTLAVKN